MLHRASNAFGCCHCRRYVTVQNRAAPPIAGLAFSAKNKGVWGNYLYLQIEDGSADPGNGFKISVRLQTDPAVVPPNFKDITPLEVFDNLSMDPGDLNYVVNILQNNSTLINAQVLAGNTAVQRGNHRGGFGPTLPLNTRNSFQINLDNDGFQQVTLPAPAAASTVLADVATAIQTAVTALVARKVSTPATAFTGFTCTVETVAGQSRLLLQSGTTSVTSSVRVQAAPTIRGSPQAWISRTCLAASSGPPGLTSNSVTAPSRVISGVLPRA
jgi:uncharacterized protein